jgi:outer membrane protein assembly factor BamA
VNGATYLIKGKPSAMSPRPESRYNAAMRGLLAQIAILSVVCLLVGRQPSSAQILDTAIPSNQVLVSCASAPHEGRQSLPEISIDEVTFSGFLQIPVSDQDQIAASIKQQSHGIPLDTVVDEALERARSGWQDRGYFRVEVSGIAQTLSGSSVGQRTALFVHADEGPQYSLGQITFKHNKAIGTISVLRALFIIKDREIFSRQKIATGLQSLRHAYGELGYINFTSLPDTKFDDEKNLISLEIDLDEGKQFYISSLIVLGLDESARRELLKDPLIQKGQIFDSRRYELFLLKHGSLFHDCECRSNQQQRLDEQSGTVELTLDFRPCSAG